MDVFTLILIPFLVGLFTNRVDELLLAPSIEDVLKRLRDNETSVNQELAKSLKVCFLSALQTIVRECHQELISSASVQRYQSIVFYPVENRDELQWLDRKLQQLIKELKQVKQKTDIDNSLKSIDDITLLLTTENQSLSESVQLVKEKLIKEALNEAAIPECYAVKVKESLFELVRENFALEIKYNPNIRGLIETKLLTKINKTLPLQPLKIEDLEESVSSLQKKSSEARRTVKLELDVEQLDTARLEAIVQHLQQLLEDGSIRLRRIEEGCMQLIFDGSEESMKKLDALVQAGKLTEILDIPVQNINSSTPPNQVLVNLSEWLQNIIDDGWQTLEDVFGAKHNLVFARGDESVIRVERISLEDELNKINLALVVAVKAKSNEVSDINLQIHTLQSTHLVPGLKCTLLDISGKNILEIQAQNNDKFIQLNISGQPGEKFSIQIQSADATTIRNFMI